MWILFLPYVSLITLWILVFKIHEPWCRPEQSVRSAVLKCLPVLYIGLLTTVTPSISLDHSCLRRYVSIGLLFSMGGDWCLTWFQKYFIHGLVCFALAHVAYVAAVGLFPFEFDFTFIVFSVFALFMIAAICPKIENNGIKLAVGAYILLICFMGWRATVYYLTRGTLMSLAVACAALVFMVSDTCIAINNWIRRWPRGTLIIMITYYLAQGLFAVAVLWPSYNFLTQKRHIHL